MHGGLGRFMHEALGKENVIGREHPPSSLCMEQKLKLEENIV